MLKVVLSLRLVMLVVAFGAVLGAALMVWLGFSKLLHSAHAAFLLETPNAKTVTVGAMGATDAFLFDVVLIIFAVAIAFGFVLELPEQLATRLPAWMRVNGIGELKRTLVEVILIYLIVDFATDIAESEGHLSWTTLAMPLSILLIAGSLRLMGAGALHGSLRHSVGGRDPQEGDDEDADNRFGRRGFGPRWADVAPAQARCGGTPVAGGGSGDPLAGAGRHRRDPDGMAGHLCGGR